MSLSFATVNKMPWDNITHRILEISRSCTRLSDSRCGETPSRCNVERGIRFPMLSETKWSIGARSGKPRSRICYSLSAIVPLGNSMRIAFLNLNVPVILICAFLVSCSTRPPATVIIQNKILRGSASNGKLGGDVVFYVQNVDGLSCSGKILALMTSEAKTKDTIDCNNKQKGEFIVNGRKASWVGEGELDNGSRFLISIGR